MRGIESFEPWLTRIDARALDEASSCTLPKRYNFEQDALFKMLEQLLRRRKLVRELIVSAWKSSAQPFPNWK